MNRDEFLKKLCKLLSDFNLAISDDPGPCFCGDNEIARMEHTHGTWRYSRAHWDALREALNNHVTPTKEQR